MQGREAGAGGCGSLAAMWAHFVPRWLASLGAERVNPFEKNYKQLPGRCGCCVHTQSCMHAVSLGCHRSSVHPC